MLFLSIIAMSIIAMSIIAIAIVAYATVRARTFTILARNKHKLRALGGFHINFCKNLINEQKKLIRQFIFNNCH